MGTVQRREREREQRRNAIVDAAENIFFSRGFENATMDDIAETAELSKGTIYLYFRSKDDLYQEIVFRGLKVLKAKFETAYGAHEKGIDKLWAIGKAYIDFYKEHPNYFNALLHYEGQEIESFYKEDPLKILVDAVQKGINDGTLRTDLDPLKTAVILWGQTTGVLQISFKKCEAIKDTYKVDPEEIISYYFDLTDLLLRAP